MSDTRGPRRPASRDGAMRGELVTPDADDVMGFTLEAPVPGNPEHVWALTVGMDESGDSPRGMPLALSAGLTANETLVLRLSPRAAVKIVREIVLALGATDRRLGVHAARVASIEACEWVDLWEDAFGVRTCPSRTTEAGE